MVGSAKDADARRHAEKQLLRSSRDAPDSVPALRALIRNVFSMPRRPARFIITRALFALFLIVILAGLIAPLVRVATFDRHIRQGLEASLGRKVDFREVHFTLFSGPGFSLKDVTIAEDSRYGIEPFAFVPTLDARVRFDKLLRGQIRFSSLHFRDAALNIVKRSDGTWNVVDLIQHFNVRGGIPLPLFPAVELSGARLDFKFDTRKTTLYFADSNLAIYPQLSGKLYVTFSGSPARTDRAGNGFGRFRGTANWYVAPRTGGNQLEADVTLAPSNLSELATLVKGYDLGVHGTLSSHARIEGPANALRVSGDLRVEDLHRWDLITTGAEAWRVPYQGTLDFENRRLWLRTTSAPVGLELHVDDFLGQPSAALLARFQSVPAASLVSIGRRMGIGMAGVQLFGTLDGLLEYSSRGGLHGGFVLNKVSASLPNAPPLHSARATGIVTPTDVRFDPAVLETGGGETLTIGGDYDIAAHEIAASWKAEQFPVSALREIIGSWFGVPPSVAILRDGNVTGEFRFSQRGASIPSWSGQFAFEDATLSAPGVKSELEDSRGRVAFREGSLDVTRFSARIGDETVEGEYHYNGSAPHAERVAISMPALDLTQLETELAPTLQSEDLLTRLRFRSRKLPAWLAARNLDGDLKASDVSLGGAQLGPVRARFTWRGSTVQFTSVELNTPRGAIRAYGLADLSSDVPRYHFAASAADVAWRGGLLTADGRFDTSGTGLELVRNMTATGTFSGRDLTVSAEDDFDSVSGAFQFSLAPGWPDLRLSSVRASEGDGAWEGEAASQSDGKLVFDLEHLGQQRRIVSSILPDQSANPALSSRSVSR